MSFPIYHYYFKGLYIYNTDSYEDIMESVSRDIGYLPFDIVDSLIMFHEYHLATTDGERIVDIIVDTSCYGKQIV